MQGTNVFVEYRIIRESNPVLLYKELDLLLAIGKRVFVWSKTVPIVTMRLYCINTPITISEDEKKKHTKAYNMRYEGATYQEISEATDMKIDQLGWYVSNNPNKQWTLDDWIADYYVKDSSVFKKADAVVDCSQRIIDRFSRFGIPGNVLEPLV